MSRQKTLVLFLKVYFYECYRFTVSFEPFMKKTEFNAVMVNQTTNTNKNNNHI